MKKRLISGLLVLVMLLTMLPISVLADDALPEVSERIPSELTTNIGEKVFKIGEATEFTFTTTANSDAGTYVIGTSNFSKPEALDALEYFEVNNETWYPLSGDFGPSEGFPMADATSKFRATFNQAGTYTFTASMKRVEDEQVLCSVEVEFSVVCPGHEYVEGSCSICGEKDPSQPGGTVDPLPTTPAEPAATAELNALGLKVQVECSHPQHKTPVAYAVMDDTWTAMPYYLGEGDEMEYYCSIQVEPDVYIAEYDKNTIGIHTNATKNIPSFTLKYVDGAWVALDAVITFHVDCVPDTTTYLIYADDGKNGYVSPSGYVPVQEGDSQTFWFYPNAGYEVSAVYVDGALVHWNGIHYNHRWECTGCNECRWIDWTKWYDCDLYWCDHTHCTEWYAKCGHDYHGSWYDCCDWYDWQDGITFYDVQSDHTLYVEFAPIDDCESAKYWDLDTNAWYHTATDYALENGLMYGVGGRTFDPYGSTTRAQLVTMLYRMAGEPKVSGTCNFTDVAAGQWYTNAVIWAASKGLVNGYGDGRFGINDVITREQTVTILYRYAKYMGCDVSDLESLSRFLDAAAVSDYAEKPFGWGVEEDIIEGKSVPGGVKLDPQGVTARVEMAAMLMRYAQYVD